MVIGSGNVVDGRVELDSELPEGASVTALAREGDETFEADPETERMLLDAIAITVSSTGLGGSRFWLSGTADGELSRQSDPRHDEVVWRSLTRVRLG